MDKDVLRGAFGVSAAVAAPVDPTVPADTPPAPARKTLTRQQAYDAHYKNLIGKGLTPKQAAAFAANIVKRMGL